MSRRPEEVSPDAQLVYQEGKMIEGDAYIISVYEDPAICRLVFAAYELETDAVYTLTYSYAQLDELFQFNTELVNPNSRDARYHWIIARLDFVLVDLEGRKTLTLALEPTPDEAPPAPKKVDTGAKEAVSSIDADLRSKLIRELETYDTEGLYVELVKSEKARGEFLQELRAKRRIQQLKAQQRLIKVDEDREERRAKLMANKELLEEKALKYKQDQELRSATIASIEKMMRQKDMAAVRKLREDKIKEEEDKSSRIAMAKHKKMAGRMGLAKQREAACAKYRETEELRKQEIAKRKEDLQMVSLKIVEQRRIWLERVILQKKGLAEKRALYLMELEDALEKRRQKVSDKDEHWRKLEDVRWKRETEREARRRVKSYEEWQADQAACAAAATARSVAKEARTLACWDAHRSKCKRRAVERRKQREMDDIRSHNIDIKMEARLKRQKHEQWQRELAPKRKFGATLLAGAEDPVDTTDEAAKFKHAESRKGRLAQRGENLEEKQAKVGKALRACQKFQNQEEVTRLRAWKEAEHQRRAGIEDKRCAREEAELVRREEAVRLAREFVEEWDKLEWVRLEKLTHKEGRRRQLALDRYAAKPPGLAIPMTV